MRPYFVNAPLDFLFLGGLSIVTFAALRLSGWNAYSDDAVRVSAALMWVVNWPHFSATLYRLFRRRENAAQYPVTAYGIPVLVSAAAVGALCSPVLVAPYFIKLFLLWSPYHFSGQTIGVTLLFARRNGVVIDGAWRWGLSAFVYGTYLVSTLRSETALQGASYYGIDYPGFGVPPWMADVAEWGLGLGATAFLAGAIRWSMMHKRAVPWTLGLPMAAQYVWFVAGPASQPFYVFVPLFHSLQYLYIAWAMQLAERAAETTRKPLRAFVTEETIWWLGINLAGGAGLFFVLPHAVSALGIGLNFATGVLIAAVQIHHFFVDGVIWKLRNPRVSSPLLARVGDWWWRSGAAAARGSEKAAA